MDLIDRRLVSIKINYSAANAAYILPSTARVPAEANQLTLTVRNTSTGAIYVVWYQTTIRGFIIGDVITGNPPADGNPAAFSYIGAN